MFFTSHQTNELTPHHVFYLSSEYSYVVTETRVEVLMQWFG